MDAVTAKRLARPVFGDPTILSCSTPEDGATEPGIERRQDDSVQQSRTNQAAQNNEGHRVLDLLPGFDSRGQKRNQGEPRC